MRHSVILLPRIHQTCPTWYQAIHQRGRDIIQLRARNNVAYSSLAIRWTPSFAACAVPCPPFPSAPGPFTAFQPSVFYTVFCASITKKSFLLPTYSPPANHSPSFPPPQRPPPTPRNSCYTFPTPESSSNKPDSFSWSPTAVLIP